MPSESYCESFEEELADGQLSAETLAHMISQSIGRRPPAFPEA